MNYGASSTVSYLGTEVNAIIGLSGVRYLSSTQAIAQNSFKVGIWGVNFSDGSTLIGDATQTYQFLPVRGGESNSVSGIGGGIVASPNPSVSPKVTPAPTPKTTAKTK